MKQFGNALKSLWKPLVSIAVTISIGWVLLVVSGYDAVTGYKALVMARSRTSVPSAICLTRLLRCSSADLA